MFGADWTLPSRMMASCFPTFSPVTFSNRREPSAFRLKETAGLFHSSTERRTIRRSLPVTEATLLTRKKPASPRLAIALDDLHVLGDLAAEVLEERFLVGGRPGLDELPLEDGRDLDEVLDPLGVVDAGELDDDPLRALPLDERLGDAELVDAVADGLPDLVDGLVLEELDDRRLQGEGQLVPGEGVIPVPRVLVDEVPGLAFLVRGGPGEDEPAGPLLGGRLEGDVVLLEQLLEPGDLLVGFDVDGVVGDDLEDQVDAALEVQAELDLVLGRDRPGRWPGPGRRRR